MVEPTEEQKTSVIVIQFESRDSAKFDIHMENVSLQQVLLAATVMKMNAENSYRRYSDMEYVKQQANQLVVPSQEIAVARR